MKNFDLNTINPLMVRAYASIDVLSRNTNLTVGASGYRNASLAFPSSQSGMASVTNSIIEARQPTYIAPFAQRTSDTP